jgi:hypothetical protein
MQPFILKYAKEQVTENCRKTIEYKYNTELECNLKSKDSALIIDSNIFLMEYTGTIFTKADADPTNDEPTDR